MARPLKVEDIHAAEVTETFDALTCQDLEEIFKERDSFTDSSCPACKSEDVNYAFTYQTLDYKRCSDCETLYISPAPTEKQHLDYVVRSKAMAYWRENMPQSMKESRLPMYRERLSYGLEAFGRLNVRPESVLELGAGNGEFALELSEVPFIKTITLLEPQDLNLGKSNIRIIQDGFEALEKDNLTFDAVFAWEILEHILEPDNFLQVVRRALKPGAPLILSTPNEKSVETRTLKTESSNILFDHVRLYNPASLSILLKRNGFSLIELTTPGKLDAERLAAYYKKFPDRIEDPSLEFLLTGDEEKMRAYQNYLVENKLSSHMRIIAIRDEDWDGSKKVGISSKDTSDGKVQPQEPRTFNQTVLMHSKTPENPYHEQLMRYILHSMMDAPKQGKLLDLGGGWGAQAYAAKSMGYDVVSVDREPTSVNVPFLMCDIASERFPVEDASIDIVFSKSVIEHFYIHQLPHIFSEIMRVLKPGGRVVFLTPDWHSNMHQFYQIFTHVTPYTASSLKQCLTMYRFKDTHAEAIIQLPETWKSPLLKYAVNILGRIPLPRSMGKWVRWSQERLLIGYGTKP